MQYLIPVYTLIMLLALQVIPVMRPAAEPTPPARATFTPAPTADPRDALATEVALRATTAAIPTSAAPPTPIPAMTPGPSGMPIMPPPWTPEQPLASWPPRIEATGGADVLPIPNAGMTVVSVNIRPRPDQPCWAVSLWDSQGQQYHVSSRACGTHFFLPLVEETRHGD